MRVLLQTTYLIIILLCTTWVQAGSQSPSFRRPAIKYSQINTDTIRVIYPRGLDATAQQIAQITTGLARSRPFTAGAPLRKIDILLQNATDIPNGYVGLGPWRSEFYLTPPQNSFDLGSLPWHELLALHEFRHVQQLSATKRGISRLGYYLFGEEAYSGFVHLAVPNWFTEGDAVVAETAMSRQGRGRLPAFTNGYREMVQDSSYWKYAKARNGSLKEFIPSHYPLGYLLVNYGREQYGQAFWDSITVDAAAYKGLTYSFSRALRKRSGLTTPGFYQEAMDHYRTLWSGPDTTGPTGAMLVEETDGKFHDYSYPVYDADGALFVMQEQFDRIAGIYRLQDNTLKHIVTPGYQTEPVFSYGGGKLCWTELRRHPRWWREDYSVIVTYDLRKKSRRTITHRSSYFMPALSRDGKQIAAVFHDDLQEVRIHLLDAATGEVSRELPNANRYVYTFPQWTDDGSHIVSAARMPDGRMTIILLNLESDVAVELLEPDFAPIGRTFVSGEWVYFTMTSGDADQIYRLHRSTRYLERIALSGPPKYQPAINPATGDLTFVEFTLTGKKLRTVSANELSFTLVKSQDAAVALTTVLSGEQDILSAPEVVFPVEQYHLLSRPVRLHSWRVYADDPAYGITLLSENTLNTLRLRGGYEYNRNSRFHGPFADITFGLWYPEIVAGYTGTYVKAIVQEQQLRWWQHQSSIGLRIPFFTYAGPYTQSCSLSSRYNYITTTGDVSNFHLNYLSHELYVTNSRKPAYQHTESRFSQSLAFRVLHSIDTTSGDQIHLETGATLPSPVSNHLFRIEFDFRSESTANRVQFNDLFDYARGYDPVESTDIWRIGVGYQFPIVYPDVGIAGIVYFKRVRLEPFYDYMRADGNVFRSAGAEVLFDTNFFNVEPVTFGVRWAHRLDGARGNAFELIIPVGF